MKAIVRKSLVLIVASASIEMARAEEVAAYLGFGSTYDGSNGAHIQTFGDGTVYKTPSMTGLFDHIGVSVSLSRRISVGGEITWRPVEASYAGIQYRPTFYTFDAIYTPEKGKIKRFAPEYRAGIGGTRLHFFPDDDASCAQVPGCPSSHHFQLHFAVAARWYFADHFFLRPAVDLHYVPNLSEFATDLVPQFSVGIGYSLGRGE